MSQGRIVNIQHFCIHDGPGIRTTVFLKGCPLRCLWCSNPNMQNARIEIGYAARSCVGCLSCLESCSTGSLSKGETGMVMNRETCERCGLCVAACPGKALHFEGRDVTVDEVMEEVLKDNLFYENSGGGVTLSGGEVLAQPEFAIAILRACRDFGIHTTVETSGFAGYATFEAVAALADHLFMDIKHADPDKHKLFTGVDNLLILENLARISRAHPNLHLRTPVVPGVNDSDRELAAIADIVNDLPGVASLELLQYHAFGENKYAQLGRAYPLAQVQTYTVERLKEIVALVRARCPSLRVSCEAAG